MSYLIVTIKYELLILYQQIKVNTMKLKNNTSILSISLTALMLTMGNGQAVAADAKTYPGAFCAPSNELFAKGKYDLSRGTMVNEGLALLRVECPIIKDNIASGNSLRNGFVRVLDRSPVSDARCTIISRRTQVEPDQAFTTTVRSRGARSSVQTLSFGGLGHNGANTIYSMECDIPPKFNGRRSKLMGYVINENN